MCCDAVGAGARGSEGYPDRLGVRGEILNNSEGATSHARA